MALSRRAENRLYGGFLLAVGVPAMTAGLLVGLHQHDIGLMAGAPLVALFILFVASRLMRDTEAKEESHGS